MPDWLRANVVVPRYAWLIVSAVFWLSVVDSTLKALAWLIER